MVSGKLPSFRKRVWTVFRETRRAEGARAAAGRGCALSRRGAVTAAPSRAARGRGAALLVQAERRAGTALLRAQAFPAAWPGRALEIPVLSGGS